MHSPDWLIDESLSGAKEDDLIAEVQRKRRKKELTPVAANMLILHLAEKAWGAQKVFGKQNAVMLPRDLMKTIANIKSLQFEEPVRQMLDAKEPHKRLVAAAVLQKLGLAVHCATRLRK